MNHGGAPLLSASNLMLSAGGASLLENLGIEVHAGEVLGIVGPNGAGKSSLLKVLAGVRQPDAGELRLDGKAFQEYPPMQRARILSYLEQRPAVHWPLSVRQVVTLGRLPHGKLQGKAAIEAIEAALVDTDTATLENRSFHTLSEGEKMRVNLARVLATKPRLILADEPTAALDPWHQLQVLELLRSLAAQGLGIVVVMHDLALAARHCHRLLLLDRGRAVASGAPEEVLSAENLARVYRIDADISPGAGALIIRGRRET